MRTVDSDNLIQRQKPQSKGQDYATTHTQARTLASCNCVNARLQLRHRVRASAASFGAASVALPGNFIVVAFVIVFLVFSSADAAAAAAAGKDNRQEVC